MALRLIEIQLPKSSEEDTRNLLTEYEDATVWEFTYSGELFFAKIVIQAEETEAVMDMFAKKYGHHKDFRLILHSLEAMLPRPVVKEDPPEEIEEKPPEKKEKLFGHLRVSREELYHDIEDASKPNYVYLMMVFLSAIVASIGIMKQNIPALIGSMVIAPLLGPNVALSFAATLGDLPLAMRSLKANIVGVALALLMSMIIGFFFTNYMQSNVDMLRSSVDVTDILLALSAGSAGALAFTTGLPATLIGVMVAVALLPPLVSCGLFVGAGMFSVAWTSFLLVITNVVAINVSGIVTFYLQNVRALNWWEEGKAKKMRRISLAIWISLLVILTVLVCVLKVDVTTVNP